MLDDLEKAFIYGNESENIFTIKYLNNLKNVIIIDEYADILDEIAKKNKRRWCKYDFIISTDKSIIVIELKTRFCRIDTFATTLFQKDKIEIIPYLKKKYNLDNSKKFYYICLFGFIDRNMKLSDLSFDTDNNILNMPNISYYYKVYNKKHFGDYTITYNSKNQPNFDIPINQLVTFDNVYDKLLTGQL